jgi:DNA polymerase-1
LKHDQKLIYLGGFKLKKVLVIDSNSIFNRAFYGIKLLSTKTGKFTNAIYGFIVTMEKLKTQINPDIIICAFDLAQKTFRNEIYSGYKQHRHGMPDELASQLPDLQNLIEYLGYKIVSCEGYEADDILGTIASVCKQNDDYKCILATGDRDILQLVSKNISVNMAITRAQKTETILYDENKIKEEYGISPSQLIDVKALQGDTSDNIPGVKGIGQKTALKLIQEHVSIDNIYNNINTLNITKNIKKKLIEGKDSAYMSRALGKIYTEVPIDKNLKNYFPGPVDTYNAEKLMKELEFFSLINKMNLSFAGKNSGEKSDSLKKISVYNITDCRETLQIIRQKKEVYFLPDIKMNVIEKLIILINDSIYIIKNSDANFFDFIKELFENPQISKITYNSKLLKYSAIKMGINILNISFDILLAAYIMNPSLPDYSLEKIIPKYDISYPNINIAVSLEKKHTHLCTLSPPRAEKELQEFGLLKLNHNCGDPEEIILHTSILPELTGKLKNELTQKNQLFLLEKIEQPLSAVLADMENTGFEIDKDGLKKYSEILQQKITTLQNSIYDIIGIEFNINSPKQLGNIIFEELKLNKGKKNKNGYSTNAEVLENLKDDHPAINLILEYRMLSKLKSTFCDGMIKLIKENSRIHSIFNQTETRTGRISSLEPNLQNIPIKAPIGRNLRKYFKAKEGCVLIDADYSQIELRVLAHLSKDKNMLESFSHGLDVHSITAAKIFGVTEKEVDSQKRNFAKTVNFGVIYGMSAFSLSKDLKITKLEAARYIENYFNYYSGIYEYMENTIKKAREDGFVKTIFNRIRYLPELKSSNFNIRSFGERIARNMPVQGSAADIIKIAMINVHNRLKQEKFEAKLILQVHDELIIESPENKSFIAQKLLIDEMENAVRLDIPLIVNSEIGKNWYDAKS